MRILFFLVLPHVLHCDQWSVSIKDKSTCTEMCGLQQAQDGVMPGIPDLVSVVKSPVSRFKKLNPLPGADGILYKDAWWSSCLQLSAYKKRQLLAWKKVLSSRNHYRLNVDKISVWLLI